MPADQEGLRQLLDGTLRLQPCSAGNSLRSAALLGGFYKWYAENGMHIEEAKRTALVWAGMRSPEQRRQAAASVRMLGKTAERMRAGDLDALLCDAGIALPEGLSDREGFVCLTEDLSKLLMPEIFKNSKPIMNISR